MHGGFFATRQLNSNLANSNNRIGSLESANNSRYTENGRINVYVGGDSKLHFVNRDGADTALNFNKGGYVTGALRYMNEGSGGSGTYCQFRGIKQFTFYVQHVRNGNSWLYDNGSEFWSTIHNVNADAITYNVPNPEQVHTITWKTDDWLLFQINSTVWMDGII